MYINRSSLILTVQKYNVNSRIFHAFKNIWGYGYIDNVRVYNQRMVYWEANHLLDTPWFNRFIIALGLSRKELDEDVDAGRDYDEIHQIWFEINQKSLASSHLGTTYLSDMVNDIEDEITLTLSTVEGRKYLTTTNDITQTKIDEQAVIDELRSNITWQYLMAFYSEEIEADYGHAYEGYPEPPNLPRYTIIPNDNVSQSVSDNNSFAILLPSVFEIKEIKFINSFTIGMNSVKTEPVEQDNSKYPSYYPDDLRDHAQTVSVQNVNPNAKQGIQIQVVLKRIREANGSDVLFIDQWFEIMRKKIERNQTDKQIFPFKNTKIYYSKCNYYSILMNKLVEIFKPEDDDIWYKGHIRVDAFSPIKDPNLSIGEVGTKIAKHTRKEFADVLSKSLGTDYKVDKAEWWEVLVGVIVVVAAIIVAVLSWGSLSGPSFTLTIGILSGISAVGMLALALFGGRSAQSVMKIAGICLTWLGIASAISSFMSYMSKLEQQAIQTAAAEGGSSVENIIGQSIVDSVVSSVQEAFSSVKAFASATGNLAKTTMKMMKTFSMLRQTMVSDHNASAVEEFPDDVDNERIVFEQEQFELITKIDSMYDELYDYRKYFRTNERKSII